MSNNHVITKNIGNLRGISTDSIFVRPPNVADIALNIQRAPDRTLQLRRGYQCQIAEIGGMGIGTFDDPATDEVHTVCVSLNGYAYNKLIKQIYFNYNGAIQGSILNITNPSADLVNIESTQPHNLQTGANVTITNVGGASQLNNKTYNITVVDPTNFILDGALYSSLSPYTSGGEWAVTFTIRRYLVFTIFTDPRYLVSNPGWSIQAWSTTPWGAPSGESITCNITVNRAAQTSLAGINTNTLTVKYGHELATSDTIQFYDVNGVFQQRVLTSTTSNSITFGGYPVTVANGSYISQFFDIKFRKGFDVTTPYTIQDFINTITDNVTGVFGLKVDINGDSNYPAAFIQILEPIIIDNNMGLTLDYWYWEQINFTSTPTFPGTANAKWQNSPEFENVSTAVFDDVIYIANGWDYPQKYDGQTIYRAGMPQGVRPNTSDNTTYAIKPFNSPETYEYATTYEQIDNRDHLVEGEVSSIRLHTVGANSATNVQVTNLLAGTGWNTNGATAVGGTATVYGPDEDGYYYDLVSLNSGFTLKIGDSAYYLDETCAQINGSQGPVNTIVVDAGHGVLQGDNVYFVNDSGVQIFRSVDSVTSTSITIAGDLVSVTDNFYIKVYKISKIFGNVAIVNGSQTNVTIIPVVSGHTIQINDVVDFLDSSDRLQQRTVTAISGTTITISGNPVSLDDQVLIASINQRSDALNFQRLNSAGATLGSNAPISNNLRINIYRTEQGKSFDVTGEMFLVASIPNNSTGSGFQTYVDDLTDAELGREFDDPDRAPNPPPISKYLKCFGNQLFYAGGERGNAENSDRVFFSEGNNPETVPLATNNFNVPNVDDDITGIGVAGTTLVTTKNHSLWAATGNFLSGQIDVVQIAPGTNIGCVANATIASVGTLMYFLHTNGVYAITENQLYPTDAFGNPLPISLAIDQLFRETPYIPQTRFQFKRAVGVNYTKDNQYLLFLPCEDPNSSIRTANAYSRILCYDYQEKNWFTWDNMNAAGGFVVIDDYLYFQERRYSGVDGNTANLYKQHRFYRLVDHADHAGPQRAVWRSSWEDLGQPEVRKKFCRCILLMDRISELLQYNNPEMIFTSYLDRIPNLANTISKITQTDNIRNSSWSYSGWGWNFWSGYQDSFVTVNLRQGTVAKSMQVGIALQGINMDIRLAGFQIEIIPENRKTVIR